MLCSFNPPSNGRFRPPLSKKKLLLSTGWRKKMPVGRSDLCFFQKNVFPFLGGGGVTVFRKYSHLFNVSTKQSGRNLYLSKNYLEKKNL